MGNPRIYYKRALQCFAHCLTYMEDKKLAKELCEEESEEKLEQFILQKKEQIDEKEFFYNAGRTCQGVLDEAADEGCDPFNACCGGLVEFEYFIGLRNDDEEE